MEDVVETYECFLYATLLAAYMCLFIFGSRFVERKTGRSMQIGPRQLLAALVYFAVAFSMGFFPLFFLPDAHQLMHTAFTLAGIILGLLFIQAIYGRKDLSNDSAVGD
jgi:uncharacterized membrane protein